MLVQKVQTADIALVARECGFDAINIDLEHSAIPEYAAAQICVTAMPVGITPLVRVPSLDGHCAARLLDAGACGVVGPHVDTAEQAHALVHACRRHGKVAGAGGLAGNPDVLRSVVRMGVRFVSAGIEWDFLMAGARQTQRPPHAPVCCTDPDERDPWTNFSMYWFSACCWGASTASSASAST
jgi:2-keto-3-deoxy-L-rhamnonate aldolase RhmA